MTFVKFCDQIFLGEGKTSPTKTAQETRNHIVCKTLSDVAAAATSTIILIASKRGLLCNNK